MNTLKYSVFDSVNSSVYLSARWAIYSKLNTNVSDDCHSVIWDSVGELVRLPDAAEWSFSNLLINKIKSL
jgi:hypothetical protein